ncbi:MAG: hypothetical protein NVS3B20_00790 [Polyangiales bacterium]
MAKRAITGALLGLLTWTGCSSATKDPTVVPNPGDSGAADAAVKAPELGSGDRSATSVVLTEIASATNVLKAPRDLAFNPRAPDELWVVNSADNGMVIIHDASTEARKSEHRRDDDADHFMDKPMAIAFGADPTTFGKLGTFATCGESRNEHDPNPLARDFMGPTLWSSDLSVFAVKNPIGLGSHIDMLHEAPLCVGIAHEADNIYWTVSGKSNGLIRFDFHKDHGIGLDDHSDGEAFEYARGQVKYVPGIPSHMAFSEADHLLYIADTGNARIAKLDTTTGARGVKLGTHEPSTFYRMNDATLVDVVPPGQLTAPSGIKLRGELLYVTDNATSRITAFTRAGEAVNYLDTGLPAGALGGLAFGSDGKIYFVDMIASRILRIDRIDAKAP